jgi:ribosome production factor 2
VNNINLKGLDSVIFVAAASGRILFRVYAVGLKKSGTRVPNVELTQAGPSLDLSIRRTRAPPPDVEREAMKSKPKAVKKKVKNTAFDNIDGRVGRIYMPKQDVDTVALSKMKVSALYLACQSSTHCLVSRCCPRASRIGGGMCGGPPYV